jgi:hypothetical protein
MTSHTIISKYCRQKFYQPSSYGVTSQFVPVQWVRDTLFVNFMAPPHPHVTFLHSKKIFVKLNSTL